MRLLRLPEVSNKTGLKDSHIYEMVKQGKFPKPVPLGRRVTTWVEEEVDQWISERIAAARKPQKQAPAAA